MKVIFLDIDGVLATPDSYEVHMTALGKDYNSFSERCVANLNTILRDHPDAKIVISSSWRKFYSLDELRVILKQECVTGEVIGVTPQLFSGARGTEIKNWLTDHPEVDKYVIIDDDAQDIISQHQDNFVYVMGGWHGGHGLLREHAKRAIQILNG